MADKVDGMGAEVVLAGRHNQHGPGRKNDGKYRDDRGRKVSSMVTEIIPGLFQSWGKTVESLRANGVLPGEVV